MRMAAFFFSLSSLSHCWLRRTKQESSAPRLATHLMAQCSTALRCTSIVRSVPSGRASRGFIVWHWPRPEHAPSTSQAPLLLPAQSLSGQWATSPDLRARPKAERLRARLPVVKRPAIGYRQRRKRACAATATTSRRRSLHGQHTTTHTLTICQSDAVGRPTPLSALILACSAAPSLAADGCRSVPPSAHLLLLLACCLCDRHLGCFSQSDFAICVDFSAHFRCANLYGLEDRRMVQ